MKDTPVKIFPVLGCLVGVQYPYRKTPDLYVNLRGWTKCCQDGCESLFPSEELAAHIHWHDRRYK